MILPRLLGRGALGAVVLGALATAMTVPASASPVDADRASVTSGPQLLGGGRYTISPLRSETYGAQCDAGVALAGIDRGNNHMNRFNIYNAATTPAPSRVWTTAWSGVREWAYLDEKGLVLLLFTDGHAEVRQWVTGHGYVFRQRYTGAHWAGVRELVSQGRGTVYAVRGDGRTTYYTFSANGMRLTTSGWLTTPSPGWGRATHAAGGGNGVVYTYEAATGSVYAQRKTLPYQGGGTWTSRVTLATGIWDGVDIASSGDGVVWLTRKGGDGGLYRIVQGNPMGGSAATSAPRRVATGLIYAYMRGLVADPNGCGDGEAAIRNRVRQVALSWNGTGTAFCTSHYCHTGWWCTDFAWGQWTDAGIGDTARFRTGAYYQYAADVSTSDPIKYGNAYGTNLGALYGRYGALQYVQPGDMVVWESKYQGGVQYYGHNAIITRVYRDTTGRVARLDIMHGNWYGKAYATINMTPQSVHSLGYPDTYVRPRL